MHRTCHFWYPHWSSCIFPPVSPTVMASWGVCMNRSDIQEVSNYNCHSCWIWENQLHYIIELHIIRSHWEEWKMVIVRWKLSGKMYKYWGGFGRSFGRIPSFKKKKVPRWIQYKQGHTQIVQDICGNIVEQID
jgi:hypothetical protein